VLDGFTIFWQCYTKLQAVCSVWVWFVYRIYVRVASVYLLLRQRWNYPRSLLISLLRRVSLMIDSNQLFASGWFDDIAVQLLVCSEAKAMVPGALNKLGEWLSMRFFSTGYLSNGVRNRNDIWHKDNLGNEAGMLTRPEVDKAEAKNVRPRPTLIRPRPKLH